MIRTRLWSGDQSLKETEGGEGSGGRDTNVAEHVDETRQENEDGALPTYGPNVDACLWVGAHWAEKLVLLDQGWTGEAGEVPGKDASSLGWFARATHTGS